MNRTHILIGLILVSTLIAPSMVCLIPGATLTAAEMECCRQMMSSCGDVPMEHSCCKSSKPSGELGTVAKVMPQPSPGGIAVIDSFIGLRPEVQLSRDWNGFNRSALQLPPSSPSPDILRI